jgi:hypothetical protein
MDVHVSTGINLDLETGRLSEIIDNKRPLFPHSSRALSVEIQTQEAKDGSQCT